MNRPFYESEKDRTKEQQVIDVFCRQFNLTAQKLKPSLIVDYALLKGERMVGVCEVKVRGKSYPEMFISLHKVQEMRKHVNDGNKARIIFAVPEGVYVQKVEFPDGDPSIKGWIGIKGRKDRNDPFDMEPVVHWPLKDMTRIADSNKEWFA